MSDRHILISGTSGGIGGAIRDEANERGWIVHEFNRADFADPGRSLQKICGTHAIDAFVFATGVCPVKSLSMLTDAELAETLAVNCGYFVRLMRAIVEGGHNARTGMKAIAISSVSANEGWAGGVAYCASKGALSAACRALAVEMLPRKIEVLAMEPRYVKTRMFDECAGRMGVAAEAALPTNEFAKTILNQIGEK